MTDGQDGGGAKAIPEFHHWADNRCGRFWPVAFFVHFIAAAALMAISSGFLSLARFVAPTA